MIYIEEILSKAEAAKASDVHLAVGLPPRMRVNGSLTDLPYGKLSSEDMEAVLEGIMTEKQRSRFEELGEYDMSFSVKGQGRYRVNVYKSRTEAVCAFRLIPKDIPTPGELCLPDSIVDLYQKKRGLVLVTGPTGSGKSTTLASIIDKINDSRDAHIITLEDPVEYVHGHKKSMVNQRELGTDTLSYANALRAALREDPDVIFVGEMRDYETIHVAVTAAETGHLVLSTLHTSGAASTVDRIIDVFPPHQQQQIRVQLANVLEAVISQQLLPLADNSGRVAAFEILHANMAVRNLIREGKTHQLANVMQTGRRMGMVTMDEAIMQLVREGKITRQTASSFVFNPKDAENDFL